MSETTLAALDQAASALIDALRIVDDARQQLRVLRPAQDERGNVKPAPFFLNEASVSAILTGRTGPGVVEVPNLPVQMVDRPRASEDPRLAKANDDARASGAHSRARVDIDPVLWGAFIDAYLRPELPSVEAARSACVEFAAARGIRMPSGATLRRRLREEGVDRAPAPRGGSRRAPASGDAVRVQTNTETNIRPAPIAAPEPSAIMRPVRAAPIVRSAPVQLDWPDAPLPADIDDDEDVADDFNAALQRVRERKVGAVETPAPKVDYARFVTARRAAATKTQEPVRQALQPAVSRDECRRCGIPGFKGCEHQLPYEDAAS